MAPPPRRQSLTTWVSEGTWPGDDLNLSLAQSTRQNLGKLVLVNHLGQCRGHDIATGCPLPGADFVRSTGSHGPAAQVRLIELQAYGLHRFSARAAGRRATALKSGRV
jgi:hypothetical protein